MQDIVIAGCGAVGSRLALECAAPGLSFLLIDDDRVDGNNVRSGSTIFWSQHVGSYKVQALGEMLYRRFGCLSHTDHASLTERRVREYNRFAGARVVVDGFDNVEARLLTTQAAVPVLHVGVSAQGTGGVLWGANYEFPENPVPRGENPVCTHALGRSIITFTASIAALVLTEYLESGRMRSFVTTRNLDLIPIG